MFKRRAALRIGAGLAAALLPGAVPLRASAQTATLTSMVFISKRLDASTGEYRDWYIRHHAPDFLSFARPYLARYAQDFVDRSRMGVADFDCITEFGYRSREALARLLTILETPEAKARLASHPRPGVRPGPHEDHGGSRTFSTRETLIAGPPRGYDRPGTRKQAILLRQPGGASPKAFATAAARYARSGAAAARDAALRVTLDLAVPEAGHPAPLFDAVILIWPRKDADAAALLPKSSSEVQVADIVDLTCYDAALTA